MAAYPTSSAQAKQMAKELRRNLGNSGKPVNHAKSLELIAHQAGFRDWNALVATFENGPPARWCVGETVSGTYLAHQFTATVSNITMVEPGWFRVTLDLHAAIDVVTSESFSNLRKRIRGTVGPKGHTVERTSDGQPHLTLDLF